MPAHLMAVGIFILSTGLAFAVLGSNPQHAPLMVNSADLLVFLEVLQRLDLGQRPYIDFTIPFGFLMIWLASVGQYFSAGAGLFFVMQCLMWLTLAPFAGLLALRHRGWRCAFILLIPALICLMPYAIAGPAVPEFNANAVYNRFSSALLFIVLVWCVGPKRLVLLDVLLVSLAILLSFYTKITLFIPLVVLLGVFSFVHPVVWQVSWRAIVIAVVILSLHYLLSAEMRAYVTILNEVGAINRGRVVYFIFSQTRRSLIGVSVVCVLLACLWVYAPLPALKNLLKRPRVYLRATWNFWAIALILAFVILVESQGTGNTGLIVATVIILIPFSRRILQVRATALALGAAFIALGFGYIDNITQRGSYFIIRQVQQLQSDPLLQQAFPGVLATSEQLQAATLLDQQWTQHPDPTPQPWLEVPELDPLWTIVQLRQLALAGARARAQGLLNSESKTMTLQVIDYGRFAAGGVPVKGLPLWLDPKRTVKRPSLEEAVAFFENATGVFVPNCGIDERTQTLHEWYLPGLIPHFKPAQVHPCWQLWLRTS